MNLAFLPLLEMIKSDGNFQGKEGVGKRKEEEVGEKFTVQDKNY